MIVNEKIALLRAEMQKNGIDAYIIPSSDPHNSEYVAETWKTREWVSGFTGSAGVVVVTMDHAGLWTDSRYFLQGEMELADSEMVLHKVINQFAPQHITWLIDNLKEGATIGFDGFCMPNALTNRISSMGKGKNLKINTDHDFFELIWNDRPVISRNAIYQHDVTFSGQDSKTKIGAIQATMDKEGVQHHLITTLDDIAWIFNIRGNDVECNPVSICYALISINQAVLYIFEEKLTDEIKEYFDSEGIITRDYHTLVKDLNELNQNDKILVDSSNCNYALYRAINASIVSGKTISRGLKAIKNEIECGHIRAAMEKDGVALTKAFKWLEQTLVSRTVSEFEFSEKLLECRSTQEFYKGESFAAIVGYRGNGAIIHYRPMPDTCHDIKNEGILLCDSGGQYLDGTTDITRTVCFSEPNSEEKRNFTLVLKGMISLTLAKFPKGTTGVQLDVLARQFLWQHGLNYGHGTGHGVGFFLNVHEAPQGFAPGSSQRAQTVHRAGMISSNEPGFYKEGHYGIRIENLILTTEDQEGFLKHETLTLFPIDLNLIDKSLLTAIEINWLNNYHDMVLDRLSKRLSPEEKDWLAQKCKHI